MYAQAGSVATARQCVFSSLCKIVLFQKLMTFDSFMDDYVVNEHPPALAYLAQHPLLDHIPILDRDAGVPEYAMCGQADDALTRLAWIGPAGTLTPLHTDPYENIYAQIVGYKYIRIYSPEESDKLYPFKTFLTNNSSLTADLLDGKVDDCRFPLYTTAVHQEVVLEPGDILYMPPLWWHFLKAMTWSISINYWFTDIFKEKPQ